MRKDKKQLTTGSKLLLLLLHTGHWVGRMQDMGSLSKSFYPGYSAHYARQNLNRQIQRLKQKGWITYTYKEAGRIIKLTKRGELEALFHEAATAPRTKPLYNQWTIIAFDIPEAARHIRDRLRSILKDCGFKGLQASVYVSPLPMSEASFEYLKRTKLIDYIRIFSTHANRFTTDLKHWYAPTTRNSRP